VDELPLLELFNQLRSAGLPLGVDDYQSVLKALQAGYGLPDRSAIARLCRTLWVRSTDERDVFDYYFEQLISSNHQNFSNPGSDSKNIKRRKRIPKTALYPTLIGMLLLAAGLAGWHFLRPSRSPSTQVPTPIPTEIPIVTETVGPSGGGTIVPTQPSPTQPSKPSQPPVNNSQSRQLPWYVTALLGLAFLAGCGYLLRLLVKRRSHHRLPTNVSESFSDLVPFRNIQDEVQVAQAVQQIAQVQRNQWGDRTLRSGDYLPVTQRQMRQSWRRLRQMVREGVSTELDVEATVQQIGRQGLLLNPVLVPRRVNRSELLLLVDQDGSMVPFRGLSMRLVETALRGGQLGETGVVYFHNSPIDYLYADPYYQHAEPTQKIFEQLRPDRSVALIFSDAGAARGGLNPERVELTQSFLRQLKQQVRYVAWLNPMPRSRWENTSAAEIARLVPMFEMSRQGLDGAIHTLRGRLSHAQLRY
jgi:uncharacterized protein